MFVKCISEYQKWHIWISKNTTACKHLMTHFSTITSSLLVSSSVFCKITSISALSNCVDEDEHNQLPLSVTLIKYQQMCVHYHSILEKGFLYRLLWIKLSSRWVPTFCVFWCLKPAERHIIRNLALLFPHVHIYIQTTKDWNFTFCGRNFFFLRSVSKLKSKSF